MTGLEFLLIAALVFGGGVGIGKAFDANRARSLESARAAADYREAMKHEQERGR